MLSPDDLADLPRLVREAEASALPAIVAALEGARAAAWTRIAAPSMPPTQRAAEPSGRLLKPAEAATIAGVSVDRIYSWAKGQRWASRPSRRCLRIEETAFRRWLAVSRH
jgi:hypothetical protein